MSYDLYKKNFFLWKISIFVSRKKNEIVFRNYQSDK